MNKKNLIRIISFVLVICLIVPLIPAFDLGIGGVVANAASEAAQDAKYFKAGSCNYGYYSNGAWEKGVTSYRAFAQNGVTYLPTALIAAAFGLSVADLKTDAKFSASVETINGIEVIEAVQGREIYDGFYVNVSNMNLIAISWASTVFSDLTNDEQITIMKRFIFDHLTGYSSATSFGVNNALSTTDSNLTSKTHPYLMADQNEFDRLYRQWSGNLNSGETQDDILKGYLDSIKSEADGVFTQYASDDSGALKATVNGETLNTMPNASTNGYDIGGRQQRSPEHAARIAKLAFAYQITHDNKYATLALNYAVALSNWKHWGVGHFLNCADTSYSMALAYDWCYDVWGEISASNRETVRNALFTKGVVSGVASSYRYNVDLGQTEDDKVLCPWYNSVLGQGGFVYQNRDNNWAAVCSSGMIIAALALATEDGDTDYSSITISNSKESNSTTGSDTKLSEYKIDNGGFLSIGSKVLKDVVGDKYIRNACVWLINNNMAHLEATGLKQYAPDGSYIESPTYWAYGTGSLMRTVAALRTTLGTDFGLSSAWGLDTTALFSYYAQSSDGDSWRYHDQAATANEIDTSVNALYGNLIGDRGITAYRKHIVNKGLSAPSFYDVFYYDASVDSDDIALLPLDRYMEGIQGYAVRDTWESGAIYAAFMGGEYIVNHGQLDSGSFVYHNNGVRWFDDLGCDNYNTYGFGYGSKETSLKYYPTSAEGNNTVSTNALTYGQYATASNGNLVDYGEAKITSRSEVTAEGSYAVLDQTAAFTGVLSSGGAAKRGLLITNDRRTVVIQDEIDFSSGLKKAGTSDAHTAYWFAHTTDAINITVSQDGKTAYLSDGSSMIRCSIVTGNDETAAKAFFSVMDCAYSAENMVLDGTDKTGTYSTDNGGDTQNKYDAWQKLAVACEGIGSMKLAIVLEEVAPGDNYTVGYEWKDMSAWSESVKANDNNYDGKILLDKDFDMLGIGAFSSESGNFRVVNTVCDGDNAMGMYRTSSDKTTTITLAAAPSKVVHGTIGDGMLVLELDVKPLEELSTTSGSMKLELWGTDIYPNVTVDITALDLTVGEWNRLTVVIDEATDRQYLFLGDDLISSSAYKSRSLADLKLVISAEGSFSAGQILLDNAMIRTYNEQYTALDAYLSDSATDNVGIDSWADKNSELTLSEGNIAKLYTESTLKSNYDNDTPVVDFYALNSASETVAGASVRSSTVVYATSLSDLQDKINSGEYSYVEILRPLNTSISISKPVTVDTRGYMFYATSDNLVCEVVGNEYTYKVGTIKVTYYVGKTAYTVNYTSTKPFSNDSVSISTQIIEHEKSDGTYRYIQAKKGCWAVEQGGEILSENERIVTSANSKFYLTGDLYQGDFVVVSTSGSITGYSASSFFSKVNSAHKRISVTNNFYIDNSTSTVGNSVYSSTNIYLNGYTVTYYTSVTSDHMFEISGGKSLNVYGPGTIDVTAPISNLIFHGGVGTSNFNGVTIRAIHTLSDVRYGTCSFNNCEIISNALNNAFTVTNRNGDDNAITDVSQMGILRFNGGRLNYYGRNSAIEVKDNSRLILTGGIEIYGPNAKSALLMHQSNSDLIAADQAKENHIDHMRVYLGEVYFNTKVDILHLNAKDQSNLSVFDNKIFYVEGVGFADSDAEKYKYACAANDADVSYTVGEHVLARTGSAGYEWKVLLKTNAAKVVWQGGVGTHEEYWVSGAVPYAIGDARSKLADGTAYNMYSLQGKPVEKGKTYTFSAVQKADIDIRMSLSLNSDFNINFYVEKKDGIEYIMINGEKVDISTLQVETLESGDYYCIVVDNIAPDEASDLFSLVVNLGGDVHVTAVSSILNYAKLILDKENSSTTGGNSITPNLKKLIVSIIEYVGAAAEYTGDRFAADSCRTLANQYPESLNDYEIYSKAPNTSDLSGVIKSAYLDLGSKPAFAFRFREDFSGTVIIQYVNYLGETVTKLVPVSYGIVSGTKGNVFLLVMKAYDMGTELTITADGNTCNYDLATYYTQAVQDGDILYELLSSLGAYTEYARVYTKERYNLA